MVDRRKLADVVVLMVLASLAVVYGIDAWRASTSILNLILVLPLTVLVLLLCSAQFLLDLSRPAAASVARAPVRDVLPVMLIFAAYVLSLEWLGFDAGTFLFLAGFLWLHGERRVPWLVGYSFAFASLAALFFSFMLPYPMPMLLLDTAY